MLGCSWIPTLVAQIPPSNAINWGLLPEQWCLWTVATEGSGAIWQVVLNCAAHMWHQHSPSKTRITLRKSFKGLCLTMCRLRIEGAHTNQTRAREETAKIGSKGEKKVTCIYICKRVRFSEKTTKQMATVRNKLSFSPWCRGTKYASVFLCTQEQILPVWIILLFS